MPGNPIVVKIPGRNNEKLGIVNTVKNEISGVQKRTPEWMISFHKISAGLLIGTSGLSLRLGSGVIPVFCDPIGASSTTNYLEAFTELFGWNSESYRYVGGDVSGSLMTSASVQNSPLTIMIPAGAFAASAENAMYKGTEIDFITIVRLGYIKGSLNILQTIVFSDCRIIKFQQQLNKLIMHFSILKKQTHISAFCQDGMFAGKAVGSIDLENNFHIGEGRAIGEEARYAMKAAENAIDKM